MAVKALNLSKTATHILSSDPDKDSDNATVWTIGAIDSRVMAHIKDKAVSMPVGTMGQDDASASMNINQVHFEVVVFGLKGIKNFQDDSGAEVPFSTRREILGRTEYLVADRALVSLINSDDIAELSEAIQAINTLTDDERKN